MLCNTVSLYPEGIDPMLFFQDNSLDKIAIINEYNDLISQGNYEEAGNFINNQEGVYGYFADFFNAIENRIYSLQKYLHDKKPLTEKEHPFVYWDQTLDEIEEPSVEDGMLWI